MNKPIVTAVFALTALASSSAISVDSKRLLGYFDGSAPASPVNDLSYLTVLLDHYNGTIASLPSIYQLAVGVDVPVPTLGKPITYANGGDEVRGVSIPIAAGDYDWVSLRTGSKTEFYYIGDLSGSHTLFNGLLAGGAVGETAKKLQETEILLGEATKAAETLKGEKQQLDLEKLLLEAEKKKQEKSKKEQEAAKQQLELQQQILLAMQKLLEQQKAELDESQQEELKEKEEELKENAKLLKQKEEEKKKLEETKKKLEEEKKKLDEANEKLEIERLKKQQKLQQQLKEQLELEKEKKRLEELKKAQLEQADDGVASHYNFFGDKQRPTGVPESGATFALLAFALAAVGWIGRRK